MSGDFWAARRPVWVAGGLAVAVVVLTAWLLRAKSGVNIANVLSLTVSIVSLGVAVRGLVPDPPLSRVARQLADRVAQERGAARQQALGMSGAAVPADMAFRVPVPAEEPELVRWRSDGGADHGSLRDVASYYRSLGRGRMVVLGEPGAGKTVLATQLVIDLVEALPDGELQPSARPPVPAWLTLTSVDLGEADMLASASAEELAARLDQQIAWQISVTYQIPRAAADRLIQEHWVLPVLDGLDEMDTQDSAASGLARPRAAAVVRALNAGTGRRPVVLVCRRGEYGQLAQSAIAGGEDPVLQDARQIVLQPLDVPEICDYLTRRFPGDQPGQLASRWEDITAALRSGGAAGRGAGLAGVLSSPWRLFLAATGYQEDVSDPGELVRLPPDDLGEHLLGQLIPAVTSRVARPGGGHYQSGDVRAWLATLARHLEQTSNDPEFRWSPTDLRLERLWPIGGRKKVRLLTALTSGVLLCAAFAAPGLVWVRATGRWYPDTTGSWGGLVSVIVAVAGFTAMLTATADSEPVLSRLDLRITSAAKRRRLGLALGLGLVAGLVSGLLFGLERWVPLGVAGKLAGGLVGGLVGGLTGGFSLAIRPTTVMRQSIAYALVVALAAGLTIGMMVGLTIWERDGGAFGLEFGVAIGLASGLAFGLVTRQVSGVGGGLVIWIRYLIGCWLACQQGKLPRRTGHFLDWAYRANLLRMAGTAAQFRHRELQEWLISPGKDRRTVLTMQREGNKS